MAVDRWGVADGYHDVAGIWHATAAETRSRLLEAMGVDPEGPPGADEGPAGVRVVEPGRATSLPGPAEVVLEDGTVLRVPADLPPDLPLGYHTWRPLAGGPPGQLIVSPGRCYLPEPWRAWGWAAQVYALWSAGSWGIGDLVDLRRLAAWSAGQLGAGFLLLSPLGASAPLPPQQPSPYSPSSRRFLSPLYLGVEEVPGAAEAGVDLEPLAAAGRARAGRGPIDRDAVLRLKLDALGRIYSRFGGAAAFDRYRVREGRGLDRFATYCALAERHGPNWRQWPVEYRHPGSGAVERVARDMNRVRFHAWVQWLLAEQLARAAAEIRLLHDLPIGVEPDGADAWAWQDILARGVSVGAPPDTFAPNGQDWGLPPFVPHRLRAAGYGPLAETLRALLSRGGGVRIDHVMGLFRLFWIPWGVSAAGGGYVRYPADEILAVVALESQRAGAVVVGEDLGTVEEGVRARLAERRILSCRLMWFEETPPSAYPVTSLASVTTHDLPTIAGVWTGADLEDQRAAGVAPDTKGLAVLRARLVAATGVRDDAQPPAVIRRTYEVLATAPSVLLGATLEDAVAMVLRPNLPGTTSQRANWSQPLVVSLEDLEQHPLVRDVAAVLARLRPVD